MLFSRLELEISCSDILSCMPLMKMIELTKKEAETYTGYLQGKYDTEISGPSKENDLSGERELYSLKITKLNHNEVAC